MQPQISWKDHLKQIKELDRVPKSKIPYLTRGWKILQSIMGEKWLEEAWENGHPWFTNLYWSLNNNSPWVKFHYALIGYKLHNLRNIPNFGDVLNRVQSSNQNEAAMAEVNAAYKLYKEGLRFEFQPTSQKRKTPDIIVNHDRKRVGIEVSVLKESIALIKRHHLIMNLSYVMQATSRQVSVGGILFRSLSRTHAEHVITQLRESIVKANQQNQVEKLVMDGVAEFFIAPKGFEKELVKWKLSQGMNEKMVLKAPEIDDGLDRRLHRKILDKSKQIPRRSPGIIYIEGVRLSSSFVDKTFQTPFSMQTIEEAVYENRDLLFVALGHTEPIGTIPGIGSGPGSYFNRRNHHYFMTEVSFIVTNKFHCWPNLRHRQLINAFWKR